MPKTARWLKFGFFQHFLRQLGGAFAACSLAMALTPALAQGIDPAHAQSGKYRALEASRSRIVPLDSVEGAHDSLTDYAAKCDAATEIHVPSFSCSNGVKPDGQGTIPETSPPSTRCDHPNVLNGACDPGSKFQVLPGRTADAVAVAHCRKVGKPVADDMYNDIAVIQYNKKNGALCFYQALTNLPGERIPAPGDGEGARWQDDNPHWLSPQSTEHIGCTGCHDNGGFIRSEYLAQLKTPPHVLPNVESGFNNFDTPARYIGLDYLTNRSWSIKTSLAPGDPGLSCTTCHRLAVPNRTTSFSPQINGTASHFANVATAEDQCVDGKCSKTHPHSNTSPIWMRPGQIDYKPLAEASATKYRECAVGFFNSGFVSPPPGCFVSQLGEPWAKDVTELRLQGGWNQATISTIVSNDPPAIEAAGKPFAYITRDGIPHVVYRGLDSHIHELQLQGSWIRADLSAIVKNNPPAFSATGDPFAYVTPDGIPRIVYRGMNNQIHELRLEPTGWIQASLSAIVKNNPPAVGADSNPSAYVTPDGIPHVVYRGTNNQIHELRLGPTGWIQASLSAIVKNNPPAFSATGDPFAYVTPDGIPRIVYRGMNNQIHELRLEPTGWIQASLSAIVKNNPPAISAEGDPFAYVTPDGIPRIVYRSKVPK